MEERLNMFQINTNIERDNRVQKREVFLIPHKPQVLNR